MYAAGRGGFNRGAAPRGGFNNPGMGRGFANGEEDGRVQTCYKCGGPNHFARDCHAKSVKCYACGKFEGHIVQLSQFLKLISSLGSVRMQYKVRQILQAGQHFLKGPSNNSSLNKLSFEISSLVRYLPHVIKIGSLNLRH